ncbi:MAG TPA: hypothetical protein VHB68_19915 [Steroidobacteraceae bacterium]|nr:hypothetical protein [Steroidobacteraceae bacterium]
MMTQTVGNADARRARRPSAVAAAVALSLLAQAAAVPAFAGSTEQAERIYERIAGVQPDATTLANMKALIDAGGGNQQSLINAANVAVQAPTFYNVVLKNMVIPWTNRNQTVFAPLNDYAATVIGMVRDNVPFNTVLSGDILYTVTGSGSGSLPAPAINNNNHYATAEANGVDLSTALKATTQSAVYGLPSSATAGVITTYGAASAFFINGTNRAMFRFTMINHMCNDMQTLMDTSLPTDRIRQDVSRSPGGDSRIFLNNCAGCHTGMDPMVQAFAYYNFDVTSNQLVYTPGQVQPKYLINSQNFPQGYVTTDDSWSNRWRTGPNSVFGWSSAAPAGSGNGAKSWGQEIANSDQFAACQVQKVFQTVCFRLPTSSVDVSAAQAIKNNFKSGYNLKNVFVQVAAACPGS